jgi:hypothetical protein
MKKLATFVLLAILSFSFFLPAFAKTPKTQKTQKTQNKYKGLDKASRRAQKKEQKAINKHAKKQQKAERKMLKGHKKSKYPPLKQR